MHNYELATYNYKKMQVYMRSCAAVMQTKAIVLAKSGHKLVHMHTVSRLEILSLMNVEGNKFYNVWLEDLSLHCYA